MTKVCTICRRDLPYDAFHKEKRHKSGRTSACGKCILMRQRSRGQSLPIPLTKICNKCDARKSSSAFSKNKWERDGLNRTCTDCRYPRSRDYQLRRDYGIGLDEYTQMYVAQEGVCKICGKNPGAKNLSVDHCHTTGRVRGLLCWPCNRFLGYICDDEGALQRMIEHLNGVAQT